MTGLVKSQKFKWHKHSSPDGYTLSVANTEGALKCFFLDILKNNYA